MTDEYKDFNINSTPSSSELSREEKIRIMQWFSQSSQQKHETALLRPVRSAPAATIPDKFSAAHSKVAEWRRKQAEMKNELSLQVMLQSMSEPDVTTSQFGLGRSQNNGESLKKNL